VGRSLSIEQQGSYWWSLLSAGDLARIDRARACARSRAHTRETCRDRWDP